MESMPFVLTDNNEFEHLDKSRLLKIQPFSEYEVSVARSGTIFLSSSSVLLKSFRLSPRFEKVKAEVNEKYD